MLYKSGNIDHYSILAIVVLYVSTIAPINMWVLDIMWALMIYYVAHAIKETSTCYQWKQEAMLHDDQDLAQGHCSVW